MKKVVLVLLLVAVISVTAFGFAPKPPWCWGNADHCKPAGPQASAEAPWSQWPGCPGNAFHCRPGPGYGWSMAG